MNRLTRYVLFEMTAVFSVTLTGMTTLMILVLLAQEALQKGLGPMPILRLVPYVLPDALRFAVPGTILFAACSVYGRMSADNEFVAIKSLGISPMALIKPALVLSFIMSLVAVWLNDVAVSWGRKGMQRVVLESVEQIAYGMLRTQRSYSTQQFSMHVKSVEGRTLRNVLLTGAGRPDAPPIVLTAEEAVLNADPDANQLHIRFTDAFVRLGDEVSASFPDFTYDIPLTDASRKGGGADRPSDYPLSRIPIEKKAQRASIDRMEQGLAAEAAYRLFTGDFEALAEPRWRSKESALERARSRYFKLNTEPCRRYANGFSCFFFVCLGAPLAIRMRNSDLWTSFAVCFLPILLVYYPLLAYGVDRAKCGALPPYSVWLGNVILLLGGIWHGRKVIRY